MNLPTQHQAAVFGTHIAAAAASAIAVIGFTHVATPDQVRDATTAVGQISDGVALIMKGGGTLIGFGVTIYATVKSGPFASLLRAVTAIASDPAKLAQVQAGATGATLTEKAALLTVTDKMPEVVGVGTTLTPDGKALALAVPSSSVQAVGSTQSIAKVI
jgi:hypothetical protein